MALTWIAGSLTETLIEWLVLQGICPVRDDVELTRVRITGVTAGLVNHGYWDDFELLKNLTNDKITGAEVVYFPIPEAPAGSSLEIPVFGVVTEAGAQIVAAGIVPKAAITGDNNDYMTLKLVNKETGEDICTLTFLAGTDAPAYEVTDFGPANEEHGTINYGKGVSLVKEESGGGMTLPAGVLILQWNLR